MRFEVETKFDLGQRVLYTELGKEVVITGMELTLELEKVPDFYYIISGDLMVYENELEEIVNEESSGEGEKDN